MKVLLLSNVNVDVVAGELRKHIDVTVPPGFDTWRQYVLGFGGASAVSDFEAIVVLLDGNSLFAAVDPDQHFAEMRKVLDVLEEVLKRVGHVPVLVPLVDIGECRLLELRNVWSGRDLAAKWDARIGELVERYSNLVPWDLRGVVEQWGREKIYSSKMWFLGGIPWSAAGCAQISLSIRTVCETVLMARKKVMVLDLDNTLWGGVLGEDGIDGIQLAGSGVGGIYKAAQRWIVEARRCGALLVAVSKNHPDDVAALMENHPHMCVRRDDFAEIYATWNPKSESIRSAAKSLNLGLDSFVFVDDNPLERTEVALSLPMVTVPEFPSDISRLPAFFKEIGERYFRPWKVTEEDRARTEQYRAESQRKDAAASFSSIEDFIRDTRIKLVVKRSRGDDIDRIHQMVGKTNQFNLTCRRYSREECMSFMEEESKRCYFGRVSDRYGDSGIVIAAFLDVDKQVATIDNLLMSCRVIGRFVEVAFLEFIESQLESIGIREVLGLYVPNARNQVAASAYDSCGYEIVSAEPNGRRLYRRQLGSGKIRRELLYHGLDEETLQ